MQILGRAALKAGAKAIGKAVSKSKMFKKAPKPKGATKATAEQMTAMQKKNFAKSESANKVRYEEMMSGPKKVLKKANPVKRSMATKK